MYSPQVLDHFQKPRHAGELENSTAVVEVTNPACGDILRLAVRLENGAIAAVRFKAAGCVTAIACGSVLTEMIHGRRTEELGQISYREISARLGDLPPATVHGSQLAADALRALLKKLAGQPG